MGGYDYAYSYEEKLNGRNYRERLKDGIIDFLGESHGKGWLDVLVMRKLFPELYCSSSLHDAIDASLPEIESPKYIDKIEQLIKNIKSVIACSIDARDDLFKSSEVWKILRGLQLLGIKCNNITVEEMERCLNEVKRSADFVKSVVPYDFPFYMLMDTGLRSVETNCLQAYIEQYQKEAWSYVFGVFDPDMLMEEDYRKLQGLAQGIWDKMCDVETHKGNSETVDEINNMLVELRKEALQIEKRITNGEKDLRKVWRGEHTRVLSDYELPSTLVQLYLQYCFDFDDNSKEYRVNAFHESLARGNYDLIFYWDDDRAYEVTGGDTRFIRRIPQPGHVTTKSDMAFVEHYCTARLNGFHEYLLNRIRIFIAKLVKLECTKTNKTRYAPDDDRWRDDPGYDLLKFTVDYISNNFLKKFNEEDAYEGEKRPESLLFIKK